MTCRAHLANKSQLMDRSRLVTPLTHSDGPSHGMKQGWTSLLVWSPFLTTEHLYCDHVVSTLIPSRLLHSCCPEMTYPNNVLTLEACCWMCFLGSFYGRDSGWGFPSKVQREGGRCAEVWCQWLACSLLPAGILGFSIRELLRLGPLWDTQFLCPCPLAAIATWLLFSLCFL